MKIVQINAVYEYSSTGRIVKEFHCELTKKGYDSFVFCTNKQDEKNNVYCIGTNFTRKIHGFLSRLTGLQAYFSINDTKKLIKKLNEINPDVVHLGNLHGNYINLNLLLDYLADKKIPTVITLHDCWFFTGHCCHYIEDDCYRWQDSCGNCPAKHKYNTSWFFDTSKKVLKDKRNHFSKLNKLVVVGVSDWITNECKKSFMKDFAEFRRIYNWIDLEKFIPSDNKPQKERKQVLCVSHKWSAQKGMNDILNIAKEYPEYDFIMVGEMPNNLNLPQNIYSVGIITNAEKLVEFYQNANAFLHLSYQETFGLVIAEALACKTPAVVYDVTAMPELIGEGCGKVVKKGDWKSAGISLKEVLEGDCDFNKCREFVEFNFNKQTLIDNTIELYKSLCE